MCFKLCLRGTLGFVLGLALAVSPALAADIVVGVNNHAQGLLGFGAQVWAGDTVGQSVLTDLNMDFARVQSGVNWFTFPTQPPIDSDTIAGDNYTDMYNYIAANFNGPNGSEPWHLPSIVSTYNHAAGNGIQLILNEFQIAYGFLNSANTAMLNRRVDDYATFLAAQVHYLADQGVFPSYIELANEPNGTWNGFISPAQYNDLVRQTRELLDAHGFTDVGIIGPGLSEIGGTTQWNGYNITDWFSSLDMNGVNSLVGWSAHTWDDWAGLESRIQIFNNAINTADPGGSKPVFITEYATAVTTYGGVDYGDPNTGGSAAEQSEFAVRSFDNTITLLNNGASALLFWEAADQNWSNATWGLRRGNGTERPAFYALQALLTELPDNAVVVDGLGNDGGINTAAILGGDRLIIVSSNTTDLAQQRVLQIDGASHLLLQRAVRFLNGSASDITLNLTGNTVSVDLPAQSTLTLIIQLDALEGDVDGDGFVGISDLNVILSNWNQSVPQGDTSQGDLAGIGDGFVGISDLNVVLSNWNAGQPPITRSVPEPSTISVLVLNGLLIMRIRRMVG